MFKRWKNNIIKRWIIFFYGDPDLVKVCPVTGIELNFRDCPFECYTCLTGHSEHIQEERDAAITRGEFNRRRAQDEG